ncbi:MAG TPA: phosphatase domain-containing protein, partial [Longimicrobiaceae bacterium]|nr:phosphatase domain-containing protein [Longimicrobiaceae bacterium]
PSDQLWQTVDLSVAAPDGAAASGQGQVLMPPPSARVVVISDIDDTVVLTGVANKLTMLWRLFAEGAQSRVAFPGVAAFYQALYRGRTGAEQNPLLYVSRGPWSIYEVLETFFQHHGIPVGPVVVLRDWGLTPQHPLPRRAPDYKLAVIREMVARYPALPVVLIGDSGQHDPEIYTQIVREQPGRVRAIYIRNVSRAPHRAQAIATLAAEVAAAGSTLLLAADTFAMAEHAAAHGWIGPEALAAVLRERVIQQGAAELQPTQVVQAPTEAAGVASAVVTAVVTAETDTETPPNVVIEPPTATPRSTDADHP